MLSLMDINEDEEAGCWFVTMKHVWYVMSFILRRDIRGGMDLVLTCFCFSIFVVRLC